MIINFYKHDKSQFLKEIIALDLWYKLITNNKNSNIMKNVFYMVVGLSVLISCKGKAKKQDAQKEVQTEQVSALMSQARTFFKPISSYKKTAYSQAQIDLGKTLYNSTLLSKDGNISCNSCHQVGNFGVDNKPKSPGDLGKLGGRNSPTSFNAALHAMQFWDGRAADLTEQAGGPVLNPVEHNIPSEKFLENRFKKDAKISAMFKTAFPNEKSPITFKNMQKAIAGFEEQLLTENKLDKYLEGDANALNEEEKEGLKTFISAGCIACHNGVALGAGEAFQKFGAIKNYWEATHSKNIDKGRYDVTKKDADKYFFKVPSLRNIEKTWPYFHDGSVEKLDDAVKIMAEVQLGKTLTDKEVKSIVTFLKALTADVDDKYKN